MLPVFFPPVTCTEIFDKTGSTNMRPVKRLVISVTVSSDKFAKSIFQKGVSRGGGGATKCTPRAPIPQGTIQPSVRNNFSRPSGKRLKLYSWNMEGRYIGL